MHLNEMFIGRPFFRCNMQLCTFCCCDYSIDIESRSIYYPYFFKWKQLTFEISPLNILTLFVNYATVSMYTTHLTGTHEFYTLFEKCCFCQLKLSQRCFGLKLAHWGTWQFIIRHLHISQNTPCLPPKILHKHCCKFLLGPRRNEKQRLSKILWDKQGVSWECANSECR